MCKLLLFWLMVSLPAIAGNIFKQDVKISSLTASSTPTTGAFQVTGGAGIGGACYVGSNLGVAGTALFSNGTLSAPGIGFTSDTGTGLYRIGSGDIGVSAAGVKAAELTSSALYATKELRINDNGGTAYLGFKPPASLSGASVTWTLPATDGLGGQYLGTNGGAVLGWYPPIPIPAGVMVPFAGTAAPSGWLLCDGSAVSRTTYSILFTAISTTWGAGNGSTTFNLPNMSRRTAVGSGGAGTATLANSVGSVGGEETHAMTSSELVAHTHGPGSLSTGNNSADHTHTFSGTTAGESGHTHPYSNTTTGESGHTHPFGGTIVIGGGTGSQSGAGFSIQLGGTSTGASTGHTHTYSGTTSSASANHTHTYSGTTSGVSANHTHNVTSGTTDAAGSGTAFNQLQPSAVVSYIIKY